MLYGQRILLFFEVFWLITDENVFKPTVFAQNVSNWRKSADNAVIKRDADAALLDWSFRLAKNVFLITRASYIIYEYYRWVFNHFLDINEKLHFSENSGAKLLHTALQESLEMTRIFLTMSRRLYLHEETKLS